MIVERRLDRVKIKKILFEAFFIAFTFLIIDSIFYLGRNRLSSEALKIVGPSSFSKASHFP